MRKTIFITLSNRAVYRNLFFFPGSGFFQLKEYVKQHVGYHIVVLIPAKDKDKYQKCLGDGLGDIYTIETALVVPPKRMLQRLFRFCYSYLIYTDTTKLLATMGTRPDEPPAGGNRYFAFVKWFISRTFGKVRYIKIALVPKLFYKIFRERPFSDIFEKYRPDTVLSAHLYGWFDQYMLAEAKRRGIKTFGMAANWDHLDKYYLPFHVDVLFAQSDERRDVAIRYQAYPIESVVVTGYPHFDFIHDASYAIPRVTLLQSLGFPSSAKFILYVSGSTYCPDEPEIIETVLTWIKNGKLGQDVFLVIRPYPGGRGKDREFDEEKYNRFEHHPLVRFYREDFWNDFEQGRYFINILRHADIVLSIFTTMALEACALDRPLLAVGFDGHKKRPFHRSIRRFELFEHFKHVRETGAMPTAYSFEELEHMLKENLDHPKLYARERAFMRKRLCYKLDGRSSERIVRYLYS